MSQDPYYQQWQKTFGFGQGKSCKNMRRSSFGELWPKPRHVTSFLVKKLEAISPGLTEQDYKNDKGQVITFFQMLETKIMNKNASIRDELKSVQKGMQYHFYYIYS